MNQTFYTCCCMCVIEGPVRNYVVHMANDTSHSTNKPTLELKSSSSNRVLLICLYFSHHFDLQIVNSIYTMLTL